MQWVKNFRKAVFLGSRWNHSAPKCEDRAEIAKTLFSDNHGHNIIAILRIYNGFLSPQANLKYVKLIKEFPRDLSQRFNDQI